MRITVKPEKTTTPTEALTFEFADFTPTSASLTMRWESLRVKLPITNDPDEKIMAQIAEQTAKADAKPGVFSAAANYYYDTNRDMKQALVWANKVVESEKMYWTYYLRPKSQPKRAIVNWPNPMRYSRWNWRRKQATTRIFLTTKSCWPSVSK